ncbi:type 2C protein phosphatase PTC6 NDAI_0I00160 [Naumovozyma dairenensis CBS 421]|uniref:PPM-type phosphatase domain-containing protein n=1 Tax=Naumovozyma dairenensis (strain ATCC 10597 / BCRC 20456 / CBS 421 / NBRC 0211 / NRRL Y-12639) TaxID=1071378 RepID=G0WFM4_NAUDC|nr:hypothetical protein NDAI_0I00160 [Naumovozyma dairenensis CBS 421]CCD26585.1 hypothetical protein NDAI_0I00160 [Naumovozyma dairenensis CBS 421]
MNGRSQSFIHLKPSTILPNSQWSRTTNKWNNNTIKYNNNGNNINILNQASHSTIPSKNTQESRGVGNKKHTNIPLMLRIPLLKFPSVIGHSTSRINRLHNEDTYSINILKLPTRLEQLKLLRDPKYVDRNQDKKSVLNVSIFDGHGGNGRVSKLLAESFHEELVQNNPTKENFFHLLEKYVELIGGSYWEKLNSTRDLFFDKFIKNCNTKEESVLYGSNKFGSRIIFDKFGNIIDKTHLLNVHERLRIYYTFLKFDLEKCCGFEKLTNDNDMSFENRIKKFPGGSTASSIFLSSYDESLALDESFFVDPKGLLKLVVTQVGDTRIILCDQNGIAHPLTKIHHPSSERESERLNIDEGKRRQKRTNLESDENAYEQDKDAFGESRFLNNFANTRAFGDLLGKREGLSCEPDIYSYLVGSTSQLPHSEKSKLQFGGEECFICLVSDGVSDLMPDQELVDLITSTVNMRGLKNATAQFVSEEVIKYIQAIGGKHADNATCVVLRLPNWGNWPMIDRTGALREEKLLNAQQGDR